MFNFRDVIIIGNPIAGGGASGKIFRASQIFQKKGYKVQVFLTKRKGDAEEIAKELSDSISTLVIAAGGDGTYNEVANGLANSEVPMAILPVGTTSVLAKEIKMPYKLSDAVDYILRGDARLVNLGLIKDLKGLKKSRYFLLMVGIGFDAEAVFGVNPTIKKYFGKLGYILSGLKAFINYSPQTTEIIFHGIEGSKIGLDQKLCSYEVGSFRGVNVIVGKASCYGGDFKITPDAKMTDPNFYVFISHSKGRSNLIKIFLGVLIKRHLSYSDITYAKATKVTVLDDDCKVQIDGDYFGTTPIDIEVVPNCLRLVVKDY
ncbi:MAG: diacylglycerol kinase family lipid kinase [Thermodesulfovibrionales bacterium]|nr:diacylglycerol kinase family lipid kinase [Thermodesulfovibrionales bacterium]